jgi:hypothetical protein
MKSLSGRFQLTRWLLAGSVIAVFPSAASAHFVWVEPAPSTPGAAQVCFGEYPTLREAAPLLDKVQGVKLFALDGKGRRELKQVRAENHFRYDGLENAPVVAGSLDYGILQREQTPPFFLRYETVLLRGEGQPLAPAELARLSRVKTDLPLSFTLQPSGAGLQLTTLLHGKPVAADVSVGNPGEQELKKLRTSENGTLELPVASPGWYHLRFSAEDGKPVTFQGKEGKFTRTYLSVMFQAAKPAGTAVAAAVKTDADAIKILKDAHEARAHWDKDFPGFTADAVYMWNGKQVKGTITVDSQLNIKYDLGNKEAETSLRPSFASLIMHRGGGDGAPDYAANWKDNEIHPLGRAINLNDKYGSWYRVKDRQILQVNRTMGPTMRFTTNVLENESGRHGFLPRAWTVSYYDNTNNALLRSSTTHVTWKWIGEVFVPATLQTVNAHDEATDVTCLVLTNQRLLK